MENAVVTGNMHRKDVRVKDCLDYSKVEVGDIVYFNGKGEYKLPKRGRTEKNRGIVVCKTYGHFKIVRKNGKKHAQQIPLKYLEMEKRNAKKFGDTEIFRQPEMHIAVDYTRMQNSPLHRVPVEWSNMTKEYFDDVILGNVRKNKGKGKRLDELKGKETRKVAIILATGPSLNKNAEMLKHVDKSKAFIVSLNSAHLKTGTDLIDYHFGIDRRMKPEWGDNLENAIGVFHPSVNPEMIEKGSYKDVYFFGMPGGGYYSQRVRNAYYDYLGDVAELEQGTNVGPVAQHFAYWLGAEHIIWLGLDSCWSAEGSTHWKDKVNSSVDYDADEMTIEVGKSEDEIKESWKSKFEYTLAYDFTVGHAYWLLKAGVQVYNCTEGGIFWKNPGAFHPELEEVRLSAWGEEKVLTPFPSYYFHELLDALEIGVING